VSPVKYELSFYIPEDAILHSYRRENLKCYISVTVLLKRQVNPNMRLHPRQYIISVIATTREVFFEMLPPHRINNSINMCQCEMYIT
jgi:hypothetical protein